MKQSENKNFKTLIISSTYQVIFIFGLAVYFYLVFFFKDSPQSSHYKYIFF